MGVVVVYIGNTAGISRVRRFSQPRGSKPVGSGGVRDLMGRVRKNCSNLTDWVGSP